MKKISICIPTYEFNGLGAEVLEFSFNRMRFQSLGTQNFNIIVSDNSDDNRTKDLCERWNGLLDIVYFRNVVKGATENSNKALELGDGEILKFLCADDYLFDNDALLRIYENFDENTNWLFTQYVHTKDRLTYYRHFIPSMNPNIALVNTLGTPSALTIRNSDKIKNIKFDTNLRYMFDCEWYYRMANTFGNPKILPLITMVNYIWDESVTSGTTEEMIEKENQYILRKYGVQ